MKRKEVLQYWLIRLESLSLLSSFLGCERGDLKEKELPEVGGARHSTRIRRF